MSDCTSFDLLWVINNATATLSTGKASSEEWTEGGFNWKASLDKDGTFGDYTLCCGVKHNGEWKCSGTVKIEVLHGNGRWYGKDKVQFIFNDKTRRYISIRGHNNWTLLMSLREYNVNNVITVKFRIEITSSSGGNVELPNVESLDLSHISFPDTNSNVTLVIGDKKIDVCKEFLALHSQVFHTMFFGEFIERGKKEVEVKDVEYDEFVHLLSVISPDAADVSDATVLAIAKLADQFHSALKAAEKHLISSTKLTTFEKMQISDKYRFIKLRDHCLTSHKNMQELRVYKGTPEFSSFSDSTKAAICHRMMELL